MEDIVPRPETLNEILALARNCRFEQLGQMCRRTGLLPIISEGVPPLWFGFLVLMIGVCQGDPLPSPFENLNLPPRFRQKIEDRKVIDHYQAASYSTEIDLSAVAVKPLAIRANERRGTIRPLHGQAPQSWRGEKNQMPEKLLPLRGYRASIPGRSAPLWRPELPASPTSQEISAADLIERRLAYDGILLTLVRTIHALGPSGFPTNEALALSQLRAVGFPTDWLQFFHYKANDVRLDAVADWLRFTKARLSSSQTPEALGAELKSSRFEFQQSVSNFQVAIESGEHPIGLLRVQVGGGYNDGIVPGSSLDVIGRLVEVLPQADLLVSIQEEYFEPVRWLAGHARSLRRRDQFTLIGEPFHVAPWAQDNGKAGFLRSAGPETNQPALLVPRYASIDEGESPFEPGESFLMGGVSGAGLAVIQSPLLFQGGNLMAVREPLSDRLILLVGEGEIYRNVTLGLTREQVLAAFKIEFGVDECLVLPSASFHLDYDLSLRAQDGHLLAFVNDVSEASHIIIRLGIEALEAHGLLTKAETALAQHDLESGNAGAIVELVSKTVGRYRNPDGKLQARLARCFSTAAVDSATANLQCFLVALDFLASRDLAPPQQNESTSRFTYLQALHRLEEAMQEQKAWLEARHWKIVAVPSLPDVQMGINYLNGVHDAARFLMPVYGGFYAPLDAVATAAFARALGSRVLVTPIQCADCQRIHGAIHCMVSPFPKLDDERR